MKIAAIAGSTIPSDTANSLQVMKACQALVQIGHDVTLLVPGSKNTTVDLKQHYGLQTEFPIEWLSSSSRRMFTWDSVRRARALKRRPDLFLVPSIGSLWSVAWNACRLRNPHSADRAFWSAVASRSLRACADASDWSPSRARW